MADDLSALDVGAVLTNVPFGEMIKSAALAIAEAQMELDKSAVRVAEMMSGSAILRDPETMLPIDVKGRMPKRTEAGVYYVSTDNSEKFEPAMVDTRVFFGRENDGTPTRMSMLELGFTPTFYQFVDTIIELKIAVTVTKASDDLVKNQGTVTESLVSSQSSGVYSAWGGYGWYGRYSGGNGSYQRSTQVQTKATPIDATYSTKYNYAVEGSSLFRTKLVPVPPPAILEQRIRDVMVTERLRSLPVASIEVTPTVLTLGGSALSLKLAGVPLGSGGEQLIGRTVTFTVVGSLPANVAFASNTITRTASTVVGTVNLKASSGGVEKTFAVSLTN